MDSQTLQNDYDSDTASVISETKEIREVPEDYGSEDGVKFRVYKKRWLVLLVFSFCLAVNSGCWVTYAQITHEVGLYYSVSTTWVDALSMLFMFWFLVVNFPACIILEKYGLRTGTLIASSLTAIGALIRIAGTSHKSFAAVVIGQSLVALGQPFLLNSLPKVSAVWFPDNERALATVLGSASQMLGSALGFLIPPIFVENIGSSDTSATASDADGVFTTNIIFGGMGVASFLLCVLVVDKGPPSPPSLTAESPVIEHNTITHNVLILLKNPGVVLLCISVGLTLGVFNTLATVLNQLLTPYGYSNSESGALGAVSIVMGLLGSGFTGVVADSTHRYKTIYVSWMVVGTVAMFMFYICLAADRLIIIAVCSGLIGFFILPIVPLALELGAEMTFPLDESLPAGLMISSGQIFGIAFILFFQDLLDADQYKLVSFILAAVVCLATILGALIGGSKAPLYKRRLYELGGQSPHGGSVSSETDKLI